MAGGGERLGELGISWEWGSQERWKSTGGRVSGAGIQVLMDPPHFLSVKPWKPRWAPSAECRTPDPAPGPDRDPAPAHVLAQELRGAAGGRRGALEGESAPSRMRARGQEGTQCGGPAGTHIEVSTLDEMPSRQPSTLSFGPRSHSERNLQKGDSTLSPQPTNAFFYRWGN